MRSLEQNLKTDLTDGRFEFRPGSLNATGGATVEAGPQYDFRDHRALVRDDALDRQHSLKTLVSKAILPRLTLLHMGSSAVSKAGVLHFRAEDASVFAQLLLDTDASVADRYLSELREPAPSVEHILIDLFEPAARWLGRMWDNDECDFLDVTRGMGRLQRLLITTKLDFEQPTAPTKRSILMSTMPGEEHSFGINMVEKVLTAWAWQVRSERPQSPAQIVDVVKNHRFDLIGVSISRTNGLDMLAYMIAQIRRHSRNPTIGVMVGGPAMTDQPGIAATVGADATALNASLTVMAAQNLSKLAAQRRGGGRR